MQHTAMVIGIRPRKSPSIKGCMQMSDRPEILDRISRRNIRNHSILLG